MNSIITDGLVIREQYTGESDRILTLLTREHGIIRAFAKSARRPKSKLYSGTAFLAFSDFMIIPLRDSYQIREATVKNVFRGLYDNIDILATAEHFCELMCELAPEQSNAEDYLKLILNSLHFLSQGVSPNRLKTFFQLRLLSMAGYSPNLLACKRCGTYESDTMFFDLAEGCIYCENCRGKGRELPLQVITSMRDIIYPDLKQAFEYSTSDQTFNILSGIVEEYLVLSTSRHFKTLDFINNIK